MPEMFIWSLLVAVVVLAIGTSLKAVEFRFELKMSEQVISGLWKEIYALKEKNNQSIFNEPKLYAQEEEKSNISHNKEPFHKILKAIAK